MSEKELNETSEENAPDLDPDKVESLLDNIPDEEPEQPQSRESVASPPDDMKSSLETTADAAETLEKKNSDDVSGQSEDVLESVLDDRPEEGPPPPPQDTSDAPLKEAASETKSTPSENKEKGLTAEEADALLFDEPRQTTYSLLDGPDDDSLKNLKQPEAPAAKPDSAPAPEEPPQETTPEPEPDTALAAEEPSQEAEPEPKVDAALAKEEPTQKTEPEPEVNAAPAKEEPTQKAAPEPEPEAPPAAEDPAQEAEPEPKVDAAPAKEEPTQETEPEPEAKAEPAKEEPSQETAPEPEAKAEPAKEEPSQETAPEPEAKAEPAKEEPSQETAPEPEAKAEPASEDPPQETEPQEELKAEPEPEKSTQEPEANAAPVPEEPPQETTPEPEPEAPPEKEESAQETEPQEELKAEPEPEKSTQEPEANAAPVPEEPPQETTPEPEPEAPPEKEESAQETEPQEELKAEPEAPPAAEDTAQEAEPEPKVDAAPAKEEPPQETAPEPEADAAPASEQPTQEPAPEPEVKAEPVSEEPFQETAPEPEVEVAPVPEEPTRDAASEPEAEAPPVPTDQNGEVDELEQLQEEIQDLFSQQVDTTPPPAEKGIGDDDLQEAMGRKTEKTATQEKKNILLKTLGKQKEIIKTYGRKVFHFAQARTQKFLEVVLKKLPRLSPEKQLVFAKKITKFILLSFVSIFSICVILTLVALFLPEKKELMKLTDKEIIDYSKMLINKKNKSDYTERKQKLDLEMTRRVKVRTAAYFNKIKSDYNKCGDFTEDGLEARWRILKRKYSWLTDILVFLTAEEMYFFGSPKNHRAGSLIVSESIVIEGNKMRKITENNWAYLSLGKTLSVPEKDRQIVRCKCLADEESPSDFNWKEDPEYDHYKGRFVAKVFR